MSRIETNAGEAQLHVGSVAGCSAVLRSRARNPLRLLTPRARGECVWAYTSSLGGGMVAGDRTRLEVTVDAGARCFLGTQASTKIYRNPARLPCSHDLVARVGEEALLILAPDPVQCFAESSYEQRQQFTLAATANLLFVDWMLAGRAARGERWRFRRFSSRNEVEREGRKLLIDALRLDSADGALDSRFRGAGFNCFATVALFGPWLANAAAEVLDWTSRQPITPKATFVFAASPLQEGAILRFAGTSVEEVGHAIHARIGFVRQLLADDPWSRKW
jgi:urease accessory protein